MTAENSQSRDVLLTLLQPKTEPEFHDLNHDPASSARNRLGIPNLNVPPPSSSLDFTEQVVPQNGYRGLGLPGNELTNVLSQFDGFGSSEVDYATLYGPVSYFQNSNWNPSESKQITSINSTQNLHRVSNAVNYVKALQEHQVKSNYATAKDNALKCLRGEANIKGTGGIEFTGISTHSGGSTAIASASHGGIGIDNRGMISSEPTRYPDILDESFLSLGVGGSSEAMFDLNFNSRDVSHQTKRNAHPELIAYNNKKTDRRLLRPPNMAQGISCFERKGVVSSGSVQNLGGRLGNYGLVHHADSVAQWSSLPYNNFQPIGNSTMLNSASSSVSSMLHGLPSTGNSYDVENRDLKLSNIDPFTGTQSNQAIPSVPPSGSPASLPDSGQLSFPQWLSSHPNVFGGTQLASAANYGSMPYGVSPLVVSNTKHGQSGTINQPQATNHVQSARTLHQPSGNVNQLQAMNLAQSSTALYQPTGPVSPVANTSMQAQASYVHVQHLGSVTPVANNHVNAQTFSAHAQPTGSVTPVANNSVQAQASNVRGWPTGPVMPFANNCVQAHASRVYVHPTGPVAQIANNNSVQAQASAIPVGHKRSAPMPTLLMPEIMQRKTRSRLSHAPSVPSMAQTLPYVRPPVQAPAISPLDQTIPYVRFPVQVPSIPQSAQTLPYVRPPVQAPAIPPLAQKLPYVRPGVQVPCPSLQSSHLTPKAISEEVDHIKWQVPNEASETNEEKCLLCKRDLSYAPKGAFARPAIPPMIAVLPCGHCFHDECLGDITPETDAELPPCIPCAMGEG